MADDATTGLIKEMTTNLLYLGTGVFALVGGILAAMVSGQASTLCGRRILVVSLGIFGFSLVLGLVVFGMMTAGMIEKSFDPKDGVFRLVSAAQIITVGVASVLFFIFLCKNIWR
jgi:hypothetical protein